MSIDISRLPSREQMADRLFSESCVELARIRDMLEPAFHRYQKSLEAAEANGRAVDFPGMGKVLRAAWGEWQVQRQVELERAK